MCSAWGPSRGPAASLWNPPVSLAGMTFSHRPCLGLELWVFCVCACSGGRSCQGSHHNFCFPLGALVTPSIILHQSLPWPPRCSHMALPSAPSSFLLGHSFCPTHSSPGLPVAAACCHSCTASMSPLPEGLLGSPSVVAPSRQDSLPHLGFY